MQSPAPPGPDQAVGWLMAFACFGINFVMAGLARTSGVLYVALIDLYGVTREAASSPFTIRVCVRNMVGPLIGLLGLKYGIRRVTAVGGLVAGVGSALCFWAPDVTWITVFWGAIHGLGFGLSTVLHMMIISQYFDKYRASALGLGYSGDCFGTFAFPIIMEFLLSVYDVRGTFLLLGGIVLHVIPLAMLLRKPPWLRSSQSGNFSRNIVLQNDVSDKASSDCGAADFGWDNSAYQDLDEDLTIYEGGLYGGSANHNGAANVDPARRGSKTPPRGGRLFEMPPMMSETPPCSRPPELAAVLRLESSERHGSLPPVVENGALEDGPDVEHPRPDATPEVGRQRSASMMKRTSSMVSHVAQDLVHRIRTASFASQVTQEGFMVPVFEQDRLEESVPEEEVVKGVVSPNHVQLAVQMSTAPLCSSNTKPGMMQTLLKTNAKPVFVLISMSMAVYVYLFVGVITVIIDYAADNGVPQERSKYLVIGFSVADLVGRLSFGQVLDRRLVKLKNYLGTTMVLMGTLVAVIPLNTSFNFMLVCMTLYGLVQGGLAICFPILISHYLEKHEESVAMGCLNFYGGILTLGLAPMIGYFRDSTGFYNGAFYIMGGLVFAFGLAWQLEPIFLKWERKYMKNANTVVLTKF